MYCLAFLCIQISETQQDLLGFFAEAVTEIGVNETEDSAMVSDVGSSVCSSTSGDSWKGLIKSKKRKRVMVELPTEDDPEFISQKQKLSQKQVSSTVTPRKNVCDGKQRTLTAMCSSSVSEGGSKKRDVETRGTTKQSKASDLASYLLSQHSTASGSTVAGGPRELGSYTVSKVASDVNSTCGCGITVTSGTNGSCYYTHEQHQSTGSSCHPMSSGCAESDEPHTAVSEGWDGSSSDSGCDRQWLDDLGDCDLSSFDDFDDDNGAFT